VSSASPYSVPQAVSTYDDEISGNYVLELKYIGTDEPVEMVTLDSSRLFFGKNSKRVFKVSVSHGPGLGNSANDLATIKKAIACAASNQTLPAENCEIVNDVIDQNRNQLLILGPEDNQGQK